MNIYDVLIIGGGPAGALLGHLMAQKNSKVLILERNKEVGRKVCGEYLCPQGVKLLDELNLQSVYDGFLPLNGMMIHTPKGCRVNSTFPTSEGGRRNFGVSVNRKILDQRLAKLASESGADLRFGQSVVSFEYLGTYWRVETADKEVYYSRLLVGADGRNSIVARQLKLQLPNSKKRIALHAWLNTDKVPIRKGQMFIFERGSYIGVDPISNTELNLSLVCGADEIKKYGSARNAFKYYLESIKDELGVTLDEEDKIHTSFPIEHSVRDVIGNNVALIGDAAGFIDPITGEGIFNALLTANMLFESINISKVCFDYNSSLQVYRHKKEKYFREKTFLNIGFQWLIRRSWLVELIAKFLNHSKKRRDTFIGIIGNIYTPLKGLFRIIFS
ncbi:MULTISPECIES: NAD(P)/FAD-dependent oxidoreductase [unclassified Halobacteriovorax]|uniref:NAD(P)/FAD-dependent oxidoreductase n=1 Tax=unclassified Halobacteriovorax TaxID=2639665 RepID=UPI00399A39A7